MSVAVRYYSRSGNTQKVGKAVVFSTSWLSKHALDLIRNEFTQKGIPVESSTLYFKSKAVDGSRDEAVKFAKKYI